MSIKRYEALIRYEKAVYNFNDVQIKFRESLLNVKNTQNKFKLSLISCNDNCFENMKKFLNEHIEIIELNNKQEMLFEIMDKTRREYLEFIY